MKDYLKDHSKTGFPFARQEEVDGKFDLLQFAVKSLPFLAAAAALYVFLKYGALIALMMIFSLVLILFLGGTALKALRAIKKKEKED